MPRVDPQRALFCNRTLNLRSIKAIGYDLDYTLVHYHAVAWERTAFEHLRRKLLGRDWPVEGMTFDPETVSRGLVVDRKLGNIVKANRFGYVKHAYHGTRELSYEERSREYSQTLVDLNKPRWVFINTLFSISESCMYLQLVDVFDRDGLAGVTTYEDIYTMVRGSLDDAHREGELKTEILQNTEKYIDLDPLVPLTLLDQKNAGKRLLLITNSDFSYTDSLMRYTIDPFLENGMRWRDIFELVIVSARKPVFFSSSLPMLEVVGEGQELRAMDRALSKPGVYWGGDASQVEEYLGASGSEILYIGDHIYGDVHQSKSVRRWRTALILWELEEELAVLKTFADSQERLTQLMHEKVKLESEFSDLRIELQRQTARYGPRTEQRPEFLSQAMAALRTRLTDLDEQIRPLAKAASELRNRRWGLMMRTGNDKSHLARQLERHADIYTARVSNFLYETPFAYLRSPRGSLPHDPLPAD